MKDDIFKRVTQVSPISENYECIERSARYFLLFMKIFGLFHENTENARTISTQDNVRAKNKSKIAHSFPLSRIYCFSVVSLLCLNLIRYLVAFVLYDNIYSNSKPSGVACFGWYINCFLSSVALFVSCFKKDRLNSFFAYYNKIRSDETAGSIDGNHARRTFNVSLALTVLITIIGLTSLIYLLFLDFESWTTLIFTDPFPINPGTLITVIVIIVYCKTSWLVPIMFVATLCHVLASDLQHLKNDFQNIINTEKQHAIKKMNDFRIKHFQFEQAISLLDRDFRYIIAIVFISSMWMSCFILYQLVNRGDLEMVPKAVLIVWLVFNISSLLIVSVAAALVNNQAHSFLECLHQLDITHADMSDIGNLTLFIAKLSGNSIGFTTVGLLTVTKEFILTLVGLFFTYFFLLLQFKV